MRSRKDGKHTISFLLACGGNVVLHLRIAVFHAFELYLQLNISK